MEPMDLNFTITLVDPLPAGRVFIPQITSSSGAINFPIPQGTVLDFNGTAVTV